jgi:hypothetical protein
MWKSFDGSNEQFGFVGARRAAVLCLVDVVRRFQVAGRDAVLLGGKFDRDLVVYSEAQ